MRKTFTIPTFALAFSFFSFGYLHAQEFCVNPDFEQRINSYINHSVPVISVKELYRDMGTYTLLDAREEEEYSVSFIPGAINVGYSDFDLDRIEGAIPKDQPILVYCSIGYRSEKIGEKLLSAGYTKVYNLFGSIFEWANQGYILKNSSGGSTQKIHTYNRRWGQWIDNQNLEKSW